MSDEEQEWGRAAPGFQEGAGAGRAGALWRAYRGLLRSDLAARAGISEETLGRYERGEREPRPGLLRRLERALGLPAGRLEEIASLLDQVDSLPAREPLAPASAALRLQAGLAEWLECRLLEVVGPRPGVEALSAEAEARADQLVTLLGGLPEEQRAGWMERLPALRGPAVVARLCAESIRAAAESGPLASGWADLAVVAARLGPGSVAERDRSLGYALLHLSNGVRVAGNLAEAERQGQESLGSWERGEPNPHLPEDLYWSLWASLRRAQRHLAEALALLDRALAVAPPERRARLLVIKGKTFEELGDYISAVESLRRALPLLPLDPDPRTAWAAYFNLCENLFHLGRAEEARPLLPQIQALAERLGNDLDLLRFRWLEGRVAAFGRRWNEAAAILREVRDGFLARKIPFDTALASLELAIACLELGDTAQVKAVARPLPPLFEALGVKREALAALALFCTAAEREAATLPLARAALNGLQKAARGA